MAITSTEAQELAKKYGEQQNFAPWDMSAGEGLEEGDFFYWEYPAHPRTDLCTGEFVAWDQKTQTFYIGWDDPDLENGDEYTVEEFKELVS